MHSLAVKARGETEQRGPGGVEKWRKHKENRGREKDLKIHVKQKTERGKNRGRTEEERASTYQLHHRLCLQATTSPPAAPEKQRRKATRQQEKRGRRERKERNRESERGWRREKEKTEGEGKQHERETETSRRKECKHRKS
jgi:hypothetical protein